MSRKRKLTLPNGYLADLQSEASQSVIRLNDQIMVICQERLDAGETKWQLSQITGTGVLTFYPWINGKRLITKIKTLAKMAKAFGLEVKLT